MIVNRIKNRNIISRLIYSLFCMWLGWYLHEKMTPDYANMMPDNTPPHVLVKGLKKADVSNKKKYIAQAEAIESVDIVPQVSGYLEEILFDDGAFVNQGDKIFIIEQRRYKADLQAAQAAVKELRNNYKRITSLHKNKFVSDKELDAAESSLHKAEAALDLAQLNLEHTEIKSPISGHIGKALVTVGNLVSPETPKLVRIVQTKPIRIAFSVTDKERSEFMKKSANMDELLVDIAMPNGEIETIKANNLFFGNEVNPDTATVPVYVDLPNEDNLLVPGNYVDIFPRFSKRKDAILVPQMALSEDVNGSYVWIVKADGMVEQKYITLGEVNEDMQVVESGLEGNEKVIVQGLQKVRNGMRVVATDTESKK